MELRGSLLCRNRPPLVLVLNEMNSAFAIPLCYFQVRLNCIFLSTPRTCRPYKPYRFLLYAFMFFPLRIKCPTHLVILDLVTLIVQSNPVITTSIYATPRLCRQIISGASSFLTVNHSFILVGNKITRL